MPTEKKVIKKPNTSYTKFVTEANQQHVVEILNDGSECCVCDQSKDVLAVRTDGDTVYLCKKCVRGLNAFISKK